MTDLVDPESLRLPRQRRLTRSAEFARVRNEGRTQRGALMMLGVLDGVSEEAARAGFVTSKRVGGAVVRNRVRRRMREAFRRHQHAVRGGVWVVLIARPPAAQATYRELEDEWLRLAKRASILRP
jgi:ribonuclease P protein component